MSLFIFITPIGASYQAPVAGGAGFDPSLFRVGDRVKLTWGTPRANYIREGEVVSVSDEAASIEMDVNIEMDAGGQVLAYKGMKAPTVTLFSKPTTCLCAICKRDKDVGVPCWWCGN